MMKRKITVNTKRKTTLNTDWRKLGYKDLENHYLYNNLKYDHWEDIALTTLRAMETIRVVARTLDMARRKGIKLDDKYNYNAVTEAINNLGEEIEIARLRNDARIFRKMETLKNQQKGDKP